MAKKKTKLTNYIWDILNKSYAMGFTVIFEMTCYAGLIFNTLQIIFLLKSFAIKKYSDLGLQA